MPSNFPSSPDDIQNDVGNSTLEVDLHPALHNQLADSVMAVQAELLAGGTMNLAAHVAAADPHTGYLTPAEGDARYALTPVVVPDNSITSAKIADGTVTSGDMAAGAAATNVGTLGGALTGTLPNPGLAALPANSVGASQITDLSVGTAELADGAVTSAKIADGTIATADLADRSVTNIKLASDTARLNLLTNGGFEVWQRGGGPFSAANAYTADRWRIATGGGTGTVSADGNPANVDAGSQFSVRADVTSSLILLQQIEAYPGALRRLTLSVSVRVRTTVASSCYINFFTDGTSPPNVNGVPHTGNGAWQTLTAPSIVVPADAGKVSVQIVMVAAGAYYLDNAMLVVGSVPADYAPLHPADDLARCQRYYEVHGDGTSGYPHIMASAAGVHNTGISLPYHVPKPVTPTTTKNGTWTVTNANQPVLSGSPGKAGTFLYVTATAAGAVDAAPAAGCNVTVESNP